MDDGKWKMDNCLSEQVLGDAYRYRKRVKIMIIPEIPAIAKIKQEMITFSE
jgi:hypothetical protein